MSDRHPTNRWKPKLENKTFTSLTLFVFTLLGNTGSGVETVLGFSVLTNTKWCEVDTRVLQNSIHGL